jgi:hypothetical protein
VVSAVVQQTGDYVLHRNSAKCQRILILYRFLPYQLGHTTVEFQDWPAEVGVESAKGGQDASLCQASGLDLIPQQVGGHVIGALRLRTPLGLSRLLHASVDHEQISLATPCLQS